MSQLSSPRSYLIIGCGRFGSRAANKLFQRDPHSKMIVVDKNKKALQKVSRLPVETALCNGITYLSQFISEGRKADYIIPAVPLHLAFEFVLFQLKSMGVKRREVPTLSGLPNPMMGKTGNLYTSLAHFICPEDCPEPPQYCTVTRKRREKSLYKILMDLKGPFESKVIRSQQLEGGVGGYQPDVLEDLLEDILKKRGLDRLILISTACRCHGVTSALSLGYQ